ncbi:MAG: reductive dehalogenase [Candidatus Bathyarchaeota archaeon]
MKVLKEPPYTIDTTKLRRFNRKNTALKRVIWDTTWDGYNKMYDEKVLDLISEKKLGYSRVDFALSYASWIVHDAFKGGFSWEKIMLHRTPADMTGIDWTKTKYNVEDPMTMSRNTKRAAHLFGASLVGICKLNRNWLYTGVEVPEKFVNVIVIAIEMDKEAIATSPAAPASAGTGVAYSKMAFILAGIGEFIRNLGYEALQCGNDTALSIPLAIDAGLGELGRNGLLITPNYGSRVRLCKILTDLPLNPDKPRKFGAQEFCETCQLCAELCEAKAISKDEHPSYKIACRSNNPGALKWYVDAEQCYLYWCENGTDCSTCITVCPFSMPPADKAQTSPDDFWR